MSAAHFLNIAGLLILCCRAKKFPVTYPLLPAESPECFCLLLVLYFLELELDLHLIFLTLPEPLVKNDSAELIHRLYFPSSKRPCQSSRPWERKPDVSGVKCLLFPQKKKKKGKKNECKSPIIGWKKRRIRRTNVHLTFDLTNDSFRRRFNYLLLYLLIAANNFGDRMESLPRRVRLCTGIYFEMHLQTRKSLADWEIVVESGFSRFDEKLWLHARVFATNVNVAEQTSLQ